MGQRGTLWEDILAQHCVALGALCAGKPADAYAQLKGDPYTPAFLKVRLLERLIAFAASDANHHAMARQDTRCMPAAVNKGDKGLWLVSLKMAWLRF